MCAIVADLEALCELHSCSRVISTFEEGLSPRQPNPDNIDAALRRDGRRQVVELVLDESIAQAPQPVDARELEEAGNVADAVCDEKIDDFDAVEEEVALGNTHRVTHCVQLELGAEEHGSDHAARTSQLETHSKE